MACRRYRFGNASGFGVAFLGGWGCVRVVAAVVDADGRVVVVVDVRVEGEGSGGEAAYRLACGGRNAGRRERSERAGLCYFERGVEDIAAILSDRSGRISYGLPQADRRGLRCSSLP